MNRKDARAYFRTKGLSYDDITITDLQYLAVLLDLNFTIQRKFRLQARAADPENAPPDYWLRTNSITRYTTDDQGRMIGACITGKGRSFTSQQVVTFNPGGFISLCNYTNDQNAEPVLTAFVEWCDELASIKEGKHERETD